MSEPSCCRHCTTTYHVIAAQSPDWFEPFATAGAAEHWIRVAADRRGLQVERVDCICAPPIVEDADAWLAARG